MRSLQNLKYLPFLVLLVTVVFLIGNTLFIQSPYIGLLMLVGYFFSHAWIVNKYAPMSGSNGAKATIGVIGAFVTHILVMLPFYYFYCLNELTQVLSFIFAVTILSLLYWNWYANSKYTVSINRNKEQDLDHLFLKSHTTWSLVLLSVFCFSLIGVYLYRISQLTHLYTGTLTNAVPIILVALLVFVSYVFAISGRSRYALLIICGLTISTTLTFTFAIDNLYGADSWRHVGIAEQVVQGSAYEPTSIKELVRFVSEKIPNASLYTTLPFISFWTNLTVSTVFSALGIVIPALLAIIVYIASYDISGKSRNAALVTIAGATAVFYLSLDPTLNVRSLGIFALAVTSWLWLRYLIHKDTHISYMYVVVSVFAVLAYPTTGLMSFSIIMFALLLRRVQFHRIVVFFSLCVGLILSSVLPLLDTILQKAPLTNAFITNPTRVLLTTGRDWVMSLLTLRTFSGILTIAMIATLVWLYHKNRTVFSIAASISIALAIDVISLGIFRDGYVPFTSRTPFIFDAVRSILAGVGFVLLVNHVIERRERLILMATGLLIASIIAIVSSPTRYNFGWSTSNAELQGIKYIQKDALATASTYMVLTDEVTSAAGYAISNSRNSYYWYPNGRLYTLYQEFVTDPSKVTVRKVCDEYAVNRVYFLRTPIPLTSNMDAKKQKKLREIFRSEHQIHDNVSVLRADCPT